MRGCPGWPVARGAGVVVIEVTDEMIATAQDASAALNGHCPTYLEVKAMLSAVFAIVERDLATPAYRCQAELARDVRCTLVRGHEWGERGTDHLGRWPNGTGVVW